VPDWKQKSKFEENVQEARIERKEDGGVRSVQTPVSEGGNA
jgi:hypothetical protein